MTIISTMTVIGLFGLAMHLHYYWAAAGLAAVFALMIIVARRSARAKQKLHRDASTKVPATPPPPPRP